MRTFCFGPSLVLPVATAHGVGFLSTSGFSGCRDGQDSGCRRNEGTGAALTLTGQSRTTKTHGIVRLWPATQPSLSQGEREWIPAYAGMTSAWGR